MGGGLTAATAARMAWYVPEVFTSNASFRSRRITERFTTASVPSIAAITSDSVAMSSSTYSCSSGMTSGREPGLRLEACTSVTRRV